MTKPSTSPSHPDIYTQRENPGYGYKTAEIPIAIAQMSEDRDDIAFSSLPTNIEDLKNKSIFTPCISIDLVNPNGASAMALLLRRANDALLSEEAPKQIIIPVLIAMPTVGVNHYAFFVMKSPREGGDKVSIEYINSRGSDFTSQDASASIEGVAPKSLEILRALKETDYAITTIPESILGIIPTRNQKCFQPGAGWCSVVTTEAIMEFLRNPELTSAEFDSKTTEYRGCNLTKAGEVTTKHPEFIGLRERHGDAFHEFSQQHPETKDPGIMVHGGDISLVDLLMKLRIEMAEKHPAETHQQRQDSVTRE